MEYSTQVDAYIHKNFTVIKNLFAEGDLWDPSKYPGFEELYISLGTPLPKSDVRYALRTLVRRHLEDEKGEEFASDFHEDAQLQRALLEALVRSGRDPSQIPEYRGIAEKHSTQESLRRE